jgi:predicted transcriptional regulator
LGKVLTGGRLQILSAIKNCEPKSIQELSRIVKRDFKNVYTDVKLLVQYGMIELKESGPKRAALPVAKYSEFLISA